MTISFFYARLLIDLFVIGFVWTYLMGRAGKDDFRSDIRRIRDNLFDYMIEHGENFNSPAYVQMRQVFNGILRLSNRLNIVTFFLMVRYHIQLTKAGIILPDPLKASGSHELKLRLKKAREEAISRLLCFIFLEGFTGLAVHFLLAVAGLARNVFQFKQRTSVWAKRRASYFIIEAQRCGGPAGSFSSICAG